MKVISYANLGYLPAAPGFIFTMHYYGDDERIVVILGPSPIGCFFGSPPQPPQVYRARVGGLEDACAHLSTVTGQRVRPVYVQNE